MSSFGLIALAIRLYKAAVRPLKLSARARASDLFAAKFRMHNTKQTVLNQHTLHPASKLNRKTCVHKQATSAHMLANKKKKKNI